MENGNPPVEKVTTKTTYIVRSSAMEPTLHCAKPAIGCEAATSDEVVVQSYSGNPKREDIIVFHTPPEAATKCGEGGVFIKRVVGLPGETVVERDGFVFINGKPLKESYVQAGHRDTESGSWHVPANDYFVLGDNRAQSCDSREWGSVPLGNIIGRVVKIASSG